MRVKVFRSHNYESGGFFVCFGTSFSACSAAHALRQIEFQVQFLPFSSGFIPRLAQSVISCRMRLNNTHART